MAQQQRRRQQAKRRGGHNVRRFPAPVVALFAPFPFNTDACNSRGVDYQGRSLWRLRCGCMLCKSRHAVSNSLRRWPDWAPVPRALQCPYHGALRTASKPARHAFRVLIHYAGMLQLPCTVVWEACVVPGQGPFDFWLWEWRVLVEVDGQQHSGADCYGTDAVEQWLRDRMKETAAQREGYHVLRLDARDWLEWPALVERALAVVRANPCTLPTVFYSPSNVPPMPLLTL
jgi:hypothetical protein